MVEIEAIVGAGGTGGGAELEIFNADKVGIQHVILVAACTARAIKGQQVAVYVVGFDELHAHAVGGVVGVVAEVAVDAV